MTGTDGHAQISARNPLLCSAWGKESRTFHMQSPQDRAHVSLAGPWHVVVDPYETGSRDIFGNPNARGFHLGESPATGWWADYDLMGYGADGVHRSYTLDDPLAEDLDVVGCNQYLGWY
ncbi:MAG: hypothetical protein MK142_12175, partial [Pseudomonadales bacterium]|nr:hypothetical protein [Pseudomonadales bacterium]